MEETQRHRPTAAERLDRRGGLVELLVPVGWLFGCVAGARSWAYERGLLPSATVEAPVVCVGNIVAGGTGKTPLVVELAQRLAARGRRPGILSRGYGKGGTSGAESDEARLYAELLGDLPRVAMTDRIDGARRLIEMGADVIVMDDGFQHRRLARELDLVLIDATRPWGLAHGPRAFLPRGLLRESPAALGRAGAVVLTRTDLVDYEVLAKLESELEDLAPGVPRILTRHAPVGLRVLGASVATEAMSKESSDPKAYGPEWLGGREVDVVSAIGHPAAFEATLVGLGARLIETRRFADHHEYTAADLAGLGTARPLVTTAKDAVKLGVVLAGLPDGCELFVLDIEVIVTRGGDVLDALLDALSPSRAARERGALHEGLHG